MRHHLHTILILGLVPLILYLASFILLTYPLIRSFSTHIFAGPSDGLQNYWNIWWINKAVTDLHTSPWFTSVIQFPHGSTLIGHTLNPINGFMAIPLIRLFPLHQVYNIVIISSFVFGGFTMFLLNYTLTKHYAASLIGGFLFTFSQYHFTHLTEHMQLSTLQWLPLFVLSLYVFSRKPTVPKAIFVALSITLVVLSDYYYAFYAGIAGTLFVIWHEGTRNATLFRRQYILPWVVCITLTVATCAPLFITLIRTHLSDPLLGVHDPADYSTDIAAPFIPGAAWRFGMWTRQFWQTLGKNTLEGSVYVGWSVLLLLGIAIKRLKSPSGHPRTLFYLIILVFFILSLGPYLHVWGTQLPVPLPYLALSHLLPMMNMSGVPVRMMVMVTLGTSVIASYAIRHLWNRRGAAILALLTPFLIIDHLPYRIEPIRRDPPELIRTLTRIPGNDAVIDDAYYMADSLYYQTLYDKPLAFGYIARIPTSTERLNDPIHRAIEERDDNALRNFGFRFLLTKTRLPETTSCGIIQEEQGITLYDLWACSTREPAR